jgi:hypothetical protein
MSFLLVPRCEPLILSCRLNLFCDSFGHGTGLDGSAAMAWRRGSDWRRDHAYRGPNCTATETQRVWLYHLLALLLSVNRAIHFSRFLGSASPKKSHASAASGPAANHTKKDRDRRPEQTPPGTTRPATRRVRLLFVLFRHFFGSQRVSLLNSDRIFALLISARHVP